MGIGLFEADCELGPGADEEEDAQATVAQASTMARGMDLMGVA
jgi:hypothetical protein